MLVLKVRSILFTKPQNLIYKFRDTPISKLQHNRSRHLLRKTLLLRLCYSKSSVNSTTISLILRRQIIRRGTRSSYLASLPKLQRFIEPRCIAASKQNRKQRPDVLIADACQRFSGTGYVFQGVCHAWFGDRYGRVSKPVWRCEYRVGMNHRGVVLRGL